MSLLALALAHLSRRLGIAVLTVLALAVGAALVGVVLNVREQLLRGLTAQTLPYRYVVGPPGSPLGLVMAGLFYADEPTGTIPYRLGATLAGTRGVEAVIPFALGDQVHGTRIVGTTPAMLDRLPTKSKTRWLEGRNFDRPMEAVLGSAVAQEHGWRIGSTIVSQHGLVAPTNALRPTDHVEHPYTIVGVLLPTGTASDRAIFTSVESYWQIHGRAGTVKDGESDPTLPISGFLVAVKGPALDVPTRVAEAGALAARPAEVLPRFFTHVLRPFEQVLLIYGNAVVAAACIGLLLTMLLLTLGRQRELAILRAIGARPLEILGLVWLEAIVLLVLGLGLGVLLRQILVHQIQATLLQRVGVMIDWRQMTLTELMALLSIFGIGLLVALGPAMRAYRQDIAAALNR